MGFTAKEIKQSKHVALEQIKKFLDAEDVDGQFKDRTGNYHSSEKFIVSWTANWKGIPSEFSIDKTDSFYGSCSGYKAIYATRSLVHEKQLGGYGSIERALIEVGLKLCGKTDKKFFFEKYATRYNERIQKSKEDEK